MGISSPDPLPEQFKSRPSQRRRFFWLRVVLTSIVWLMRFAAGRLIPEHICARLLNRLGIALPDGKFESAVRSMVTDRRSGRETAHGALRSRTPNRDRFLMSRARRFSLSSPTGLLSTSSIAIRKCFSRRRSAQHLSRQGLSSRLPHGQPDTEGRALAELARHFKAAVVFLHDAIGD